MLPQRSIRTNAGSASGWLPRRRPRRGELPGYQAFAADHRVFHELVSEIVTAHAQGNSSDGIARLGELYCMCDNLMDQLEMLQQS